LYWKSNVISDPVILEKTKFWFHLSTKYSSNEVCKGHLCSNITAIEQYNILIAIRHRGIICFIYSLFKYIIYAIYTFLYFIYITIKMYRLSWISLNLQKVWLLVWRVRKFVGPKNIAPKAKEGSHWQKMIHLKGTQPAYTDSTWTRIIFLATRRKNTNSFNTQMKWQKTQPFTRSTTASRSLPMQNNVVCTKAY